LVHHAHINNFVNSQRYSWQPKSKLNKKFEPMLTRRAKAYSSSCSQVVWVYMYLHPLRRNSLFCSQKLLKIAKNH